MLQHLPSRRDENGFTLVELLVVIAILGILAGVAVFSLTSVGDNGNANACKTEKSIVNTAIAVATSQGTSGGAIDTAVSGMLASTPSYYTSSSGVLTAVGTPPC
ncbi:MAG: hypothetical protein QOI42_1120 [Frankiaceae bacterium]|nr:hypothetical protein [Frankiaceae bacterium]